MTKLFQFVVQGKGTFPFPLLARVPCWPTNEEYAWKMTRDNMRTISLTSFEEPKEKDWKIFGWKMIIVDVVKTC